MKTEEERLAASCEASRIWRAKNPEKVRAAALRYRERNLEKCRERSRRYQAEHPVERREAVQRYRDAHPESSRAISRRSHERHRETVKAIQARWHQNNPDIVQEHRRRRRARKAGVTRVIKADMNGPCAICLRPIDRSLKHPDPMSFSRGHEPPLAWAAANGITESIERPEHLTCNLRKGTRPDALLARVA